MPEKYGTLFSCNEKAAVILWIIAEWNRGLGGTASEFPDVSAEDAK